MANMVTVTLPVPNPLYLHLQSKGSMTKDNPELIRLADAIGWSPDWTYKFATGQRPGSEALVKAIVRESGNKRITLASLGVPSKPNVPARPPARKHARGAKDRAVRAALPVRA